MAEYAFINNSSLEGIVQNFKTHEFDKYIREVGKATRDVMSGDLVNMEGGNKFVWWDQLMNRIACRENDSCCRHAATLYENHVFSVHHISELA